MSRPSTFLTHCVREGGLSKPPQVSDVNDTVTMPLCCKQLGLVTRLVVCLCVVVRAMKDGPVSGFQEPLVPQLVPGGPAQWVALGTRVTTSPPLTLSTLQSLASPITV